MRAIGGSTMSCAVVAAIALNGTAAGAAGEGVEWLPREYLLKSLVSGVEGALKKYHPETGRFGSEPWICRDQNVLFPLAAAWSIEDPANPWYHNDEVLAAIAKGGEALVEDQDKDGKWTFRKKDNSTWGQIHMPWTYSRWIRAYSLVRDALPPASREIWERGLRLGYKGIRRYANGGVHNIPTHHAMSLFIAGQCFGESEWQDAARRFMAKVVKKQDAAGFWSEHSGPVVGYNFVYVDALGIYYHFSRDPIVLEALGRAARFHALSIWPDSTCVSTIDERQIYHKGIRAGNVGFTWTDEGRGFMRKQLATFSRDGKRLLAADAAAALLLYSGSGEVVPPPSDAGDGTAYLGERDAALCHAAPWHWAISGYACQPLNNRWIQDRQSFLDVYHEKLGVVIGGGNTKLQPYWSTFTVGDPSLLGHRAGDEKPNFTPDIDLRWMPDAAKIAEKDGVSCLTLSYGDVDCRVACRASGEDKLRLTFKAPVGRRVEAHLPLMMRQRRLRLANGEEVRLADDPVVLGSKEIGDSFLYGDLRVSVPAGASLRWPARQHNQYKKDGSSPLKNAKLVLVLPFDKTDRYDVDVAYEPAAAFEGIALEARDLPFAHTGSTYTKALDMFGSQFLGGTKDGDRLAFAVSNVPGGTYELLGEFVMAYSYGIVRVLVDGKVVGKPFDGYCEGIDSEGERVSFGQVEWSAGAHEIAIEIAGKNPQASAQLISVKRWLFLPLAVK